MKSKIGGGTITYLKGFLETYKSNKYVNFKQLCSKLADIVGLDAFEYNTCCWIAHQLGLPGFRLYEKMIAWKEKDYSETRGRSGVSTATSNAIYKEWIDTSIVTVDRRNGRDMVTISQAKYVDKYRRYNIHMYEKIIPFINQRNIPMYKSLRLVTTQTYGMMQKRLETFYKFYKTN